MQDIENFERARLYFKLCLCDYYLDKCCYSLVPNLPICSLEVLFSDVIEKAHITNSFECSSAKILPVLFVQTEVIDDQLHVLVLGFTEQNGYIFIDESNFEINDDIQYSLQDYCNTTVKIAS